MFTTIRRFNIHGRLGSLGESNPCYAGPSPDSSWHTRMQAVQLRCVSFAGAQPGAAARVQIRGLDFVGLQGQAPPAPRLSGVVAAAVISRGRLEARGTGWTDSVW